MGTAVLLREDFNGASLRALAKKSKDGNRTRRLWRSPRSMTVAREVTQRASAGLQTIRDWVLRFNARGPDGLVDGKAPGQRSKLSDDHRHALAAMVEAGPIPAIHGVVRWWLIDLAQWIFEDRISVTKQILSRELRAMGYRKLSVRPRHHARDEAAAALFKKTSQPSWKPSRRKRAVHGRSADRPEEQDHSALGQARHAALRPARSTNRVGLYFRSHLPGRRQKRRLGFTVLQH
jgi:transposase